MKRYLSLSFALVIVFLSVPRSASGQGQLFTEVTNPVRVSGVGVPFPALRNLRAAWGDFDADGELDLVLCGVGTNGPETRLYRQRAEGLYPPFLEVTNHGLPHVQDGSLAWGDVDNDGDLDLALTGTVSGPTQPEIDDVPAADFRSAIYRNNGTNSGGPLFGNPIDLPLCRYGTVSWADANNDGDLDIFISGIGTDGHAFSRLYGSPRRTLNLEAVFLMPEGIARVENGEEPFGGDGLLTRRVTWVDNNRDGFLDLVLTGTRAQTAFYLFQYEHQVWMNSPWQRTSLGSFTRSGGGGEILGIVLNSYPPVPLWDGSDWFGGEPISLTSFPWGGVGDWDGDGFVDMAFLTGYHASPRGSAYVSVLHQGGLAVPDDVVPGFALINSPTLGEFGLAAQHSADFLSVGGQQSLASVFPGGQYSMGFPVFRLFADDGSHGLAEASHNLPPALFNGVLEAADFDKDRYLDFLHSGLDETLEPHVRLYRHNVLGVPANERPNSPGNLSVEVLPYSLMLRWSPPADDHTSSAALRYALYLRDAAGNYLIRPNAIGPDFLQGDSQGLRLTPGVDGTLQTTFFEFKPANLVIPDGTYYWDVQSIDSAGRGSVFAGGQRFTVGYTNPYPAGELSGTIPYRDAAMDLGDFDSDGDLDVVLAGNSTTNQYPNADTTVLSRNLGQGIPGIQSFTDVATLPRISEGMMRWGDMDGDGDLDLAISGESYQQPLTQVFENRGGVLHARHLLTGVTQSALDWADFDNDGDLDLIVTGYRNNLPLTRLYRNDGTNFMEQPTTLPNVGSGAVAWGDFDRDGDLDLLLCGDSQRYDAPVPPVTVPPFHLRPPNTYYMAGHPTAPPPKPTTTLVRNDGLNLFGGNAGKWQFTPVPAELPPLISSFRVAGGTAMSARAEWCDLDGDGYPDLVLGGLRIVPGYEGYGTPTVKIVRNGGVDTNTLGGWFFLPGNELLTDALPRSLQSLSCADWDNDGAPDILLSGRINDVGNVPTQIVHNDSMSFTRRSYLRSTDSNAMQFASGLAGFGHFTADGNVDVFLSGMWGIRSLNASPWGTVGRLFDNRPPDTNLPPALPTGLTISTQGTTIILSWQLSSDDHTPASGLTYNLLVEYTNGTPGGMPAMADPLTGTRRVARVGNVGSRTSWTLRNLPAGEYRWAVQAIDSALLPSAFTVAAQTFTAPPPVPPAVTPPAPLTAWHQGNPAPASIDFLGVAAARNARIVPGRRGQLALSARGGPFQLVDSGVFTDLHDAAIDPEGATVVGEAGVIRTSNDGVIWSESPSGVSGTLRSIMRGSSGWIAAGDDTVLYSSDRLTWIPAAFPAGTVVHDLVWGLSRYVAVGERAGLPVVLTSPGGLIWTEVTPTGLSAGALLSVATDGSTFVAVGGHGAFPGTKSIVLHSSDGVTWTATETPDTQPMLGITHATQGWFAVDRHSLLRSIDGQTWQFYSRPSGFLPPNFTCLAVDGALLTAAGDGGNIFDLLLPSSVFTRRGGNGSIAVYHDVQFLAANANTVVAAPSSGISYSSQDGGRTWRASSYDGAGISGVVFGHGRFVRTGNHIETSTDGVNWQVARQTGTAAIVFDGTRFVAATRGTTFLISFDGLTWSESPSAFFGTTAMASGLGQYMALDYQGHIYVSTNGASWTQTAQPGAERLAFAHDRFFIMNDSGLIQSSTDGTSWQTVSGLPLGSIIEQVIWHRDRFIAVGGPNALLASSLDGTNWNTAPVATSGTLTAALSTDAGLIVAGSAQALLLSRDPIAQSVTNLQPVIGLSGQPTPNTFRLTVTGFPGQTVTVEISSDLETWIPLQRFALTGGTEMFEVTSQTAPPPNGFFRLQWSF